MWNTIDEDRYWENKREEFEGSLSVMMPAPERILLPMDDCLEDLEKEYGCSMEELPEDDLGDIVFRMKGKRPLSAEYDPAVVAIFYIEPGKEKVSTW